MMTAVGALAWNGFREARRNKVTVVLGGFALVTLLCSTLVTEVTVNTFDRVLTDFGLGTMSLILAFLTIFLSTGQLTREIERRTIFLVVSKPLSRSAFLVGRLAGTMLTIAALLAAMTLMFFAELRLNGTAVQLPHLIASLGLFFELLVVASIGFLVSTFTSQTVAAIVTTGLYVAGHLAGDLYNLAQKSAPAVKFIARAAYYVLPNLERVNFRPLATYNLLIPASQFGSAALYAMAYALVATVLGTIIFERRDFR